MKTTRIFIFLSALSFSFWIGIADAAEKTQTLPGGTTVVLTDRGKPRPLRPKMPSRQIISCYYDCGELTIDFAVPEGICQLQLTESTGASMSYTVDSADLSATVFVGTITESEIELTTESGNTYSGLLTAEY